jgi:hypothetical protein
MTEEREHAILPAVTLLGARKLIETIRVGEAFCSFSFFTGWWQKPRWN